MSLFKRGGFKAVNEEKARQEKNRENMQKGLWRFFIRGDGDEADIVFLTEEPINFYEHTIKTRKNGREIYENIPCIGADCVHCANEDRPSFKSAWLVVDRRKFEYKDKDGNKKTGKDQVRLFVYGTRVSGQLDRYHTKYGLVGREYTMVRTGKDTQTSYMFERGDKFEFTEKELEQLLPEALKEEYDGTMDSLYSIVENQIKMLLDDSVENEDEEEEDNEEEDLIDIEEDEEEIEDVEEDMSKKKLEKRKKVFKKSRNIENKVRPTIKNIIKKKM